MFSSNPNNTNRHENKPLFNETDDIDSKVDKLTRDKISKDRNLPPYLISKKSELYKNTFEQIKKDFINGNVKLNDNETGGNESDSDDNDLILLKKSDDSNDEPKEPKEPNEPKEPKVSLTKPSFKWMNLPNENDLDNYSKCNEICKQLVKLYKERFVDIQNKLIELKDIINDIEKYSGY